MNTGVKREAIKDIEYAEKLTEAGKIAEQVKALLASGQVKELEQIVAGVDRTILNLVKSLVPNSNL